MRWHTFVRGAWRQLPVETVIVAAAAAGAIGLVHDDRQVWCWRLVLSGLIAAPLAFAAHRGVPRRPVVAGALAAAGVLGAVTAALRSDGDLSRAAFHWPYLLALIAALLVPFVVPGPRFARFVRRFFEQTTTWAVVCAAAIAALRVVTIALEQLFDLRVERVAIDASIVVGAALVLVYLHRLRDDEPAGGGRIPELWRRLATMVGAPFVATMLVILAAYEIASRLRGELPRNVLSPLILAAGLAGFVTTLIVSAVLDETAGTGVLSPIEPHRWTRRASVRLTRAFPVVLLALLPMAWWALWMRIDQHGVTPFRAVRATGLACLTVLSVLGALRWWRARRALAWEVPVVVLAGALIAAFGPLGAVPLSIRSQTARVARMLDDARAHPYALQIADPTYELAPERHAELAAALRMVAELGGAPAVHRALGAAFDHCGLPWQTDACLAELRVVRSDPPATPPADAAPVVTALVVRGRIPTAAGDVERIDLRRPSDEPATGQVDGFALGPDELIRIDHGAAVARAHLGRLLALPAPAPGPVPTRWEALPDDVARGELPAMSWPLVASDGRIVADVAIDRLELSRAGDRRPQIVGLTATVVWRRAR